MHESQVDNFPSSGTVALQDSRACEFEEDPSISAEAARRLSCDASVVALVEDADGEPLNVGRKTRTISASLRRFLNAHERAVKVQVLDDGAFRFVQPDGEVSDSVAKYHVYPFADWTQLSAGNHNRGTTINARTATTRWQGEPCDYGSGVEVLLKSREISVGHMRRG